MDNVDGAPKVGLMDAMLEVEEDRSELDKVFEQLLDPTNIQHNTELNRNEVLAFSVLRPIARKYGFTVLEEFIRENFINRVSKGRAGKKELVKIISRQMDREEAHGMNGGGFGALTQRRQR